MYFYTSLVERVLMATFLHESSKRDAQLHPFLYLSSKRGTVLYHSTCSARGQVSPLFYFEVATIGARRAQSATSQATTCIYEERLQVPKDSLSSWEDGIFVSYVFLYIFSREHVYLHKYTCKHKIGARFVYVSREV